MIVHKGTDWVIFNEDRMNATDVSEPADVFFSDPEYNYGINYGRCKDNEEPRAYINRLMQWLHVADQRLRPGGSAWIMLPDEWVSYADVYCRDMLNWQMVNWIKWAETFGTYLTSKFGRCSRHILYYVKPPVALRWWDSSRIKIPSDRQLKYNDKRAVEGGKVPGDVWDFPRVCGTHKERCPDVPTQLPEALLFRIVDCSCPIGGKVLEFCAGSGSLGRAVIRGGMGRAYEGWEFDAQTAEVAARRIREVERDYGKGIPDGPSLLDSLPDELR